MGRLFAVGVVAMLAATIARAQTFEITDFPQGDVPVDRTGRSDASDALSRAIAAANEVTARGLPACVHIPTGTFRISRNPPQFARAGCIRGDGSAQSILVLDDRFAGDLFTWSEAWAPTTPGPRATGLRIEGSPSPAGLQNAFVFYDRNDQVFMDEVVVNNLHGRALYSGVTQHKPQAYMREAHLRSLRFFNDGAPGVPVVEFSSEGVWGSGGRPDATNEIRMSQVDIYGARGPSFVIRNNGGGVVRSITVDQLRIEGKEDGTTEADLLTIGDAKMKGGVAGISLTNLELVDPYRGFAAIRLAAAPGTEAPYLISVQGTIGGGLPHGEGLRIDAGRTSNFHLSNIHTEGTNVVVGRGVSQVLIDGYGAEACWTYSVDPTSINGISTPATYVGLPTVDGVSAAGRQRRCAGGHRP